MKKYDREAIREAMKLYAVSDSRWLDGRKLADVVEASLKGGVTFFQLREKDLDQASMLAEAKELKVLCERLAVPFVINDNVEVALASDADGVHVGQSDMALLEARRLLGPDKIIGVSASTLELALEAEKNGADYIGVGAVFTTGTKTDASSVSHEALTKICEAVTIPVVAIGGIQSDNLHELTGTGIDGIAVVSAIYASEAIEASTARLAMQMDRLLLQQKAKAVIFDFDGVLVDSLSIWEDLGARYLRSKHLVPEEELKNKLADKSLTQAAEYFQADYGVQDDVKTIISDINGIIEYFYREEVMMKEGTGSILKYFADESIPMMIASASSALLVEAATQRLGIRDYFKGIISCEDAGAGKDEPAIYLQVAERMGFKPADILVFEDAFYAAQTASEAGFMVCGVKDAYSFKVQDDWTKTTDIFVESLSDLYGGKNA